VIEDLRFAARSLRKNAGLTAVAVATLALGIGASTAIFGAIRSLLFRPLPVENAERIVVGFAMREGFDPFATSLLEYALYRSESRSFEESGMGAPRSFELAGRGEPEHLPASAVTFGHLATLGVRPALGRLFTAAEDRPGGPAVALLGYALWQRRFGGDAGILGRPIDLDGRPHTIIGILPPGFDMPYASAVWVPMQVDIESLPLDRRAVTGYEMVARLKPGVTLEQADRELKELARRLETEYPQIRKGWSYRLIPLRRHLLGDLEGRIQRSLFVLAAAVGFLLSICCANVASILLVRGVARQGGISVRRALGASRGRLFRQTMLEGLLLALAGGAAGILAAFWTLPFLKILNPISLVMFRSVLADFRIDGPAAIFCLALSLLTGALFGAIPAAAAVGERRLVSSIRLRDARATAASGRNWLGVLVTAEIAVAATLLVGCGLLVESFRSLRRLEPGFRPDRMLLAELPLSKLRYPRQDDRLAFESRLLDRVRALPGVVSAGTTTNVPLQLGVTIDTQYTVEGTPPARLSEVPIAALRMVSPGYLETLGVRLVRGRLLTEEDRAGSAPVAVVTEELAREAWPGQDPLGRRLRRGRPGDERFPWRTVVGVVRNVKEDRFNFRIDRAALYLPYAQDGFIAVEIPLNLAVRSAGDPTSLASAVREAVRALDAEQPVENLRTAREHLEGVLTTERFGAALAGTLAPLGLVLAALGLYAVMAYSVAQRTGEIGIRMALGAAPKAVLKLVLRRGIVLSGIGVAIGLVGARAMASLLSGALYGVAPTDLRTFGLAAAVLSAVALAACLVPARRAMRVDPIAALRGDA